ncbi:MAG: PhzF family phenazine biosynthesis protein [Acidobacteriaceae bacterium]
MARVLGYSLLDVFADRPLEGNALAVFHDAGSLSGAEMQAIAREMHLSETTFVVREDAETEAREGVRVRIFTSEEELPFAGHPTLGTATWLRLHDPRLRGVGGEDDGVTLRLGVGPIRVHFEPQQEGVAGLQGTMLQNDPVFGARHDRAEVARLIGVGVEDLSADPAPQTVSTGIPFCIVLLRSVAALRRMQLAQREAEAWLAKKETHFLYCIAPAEDSAQDLERGERLDAVPEATADASREARKGASVAGQRRWRARMQFYGGEDPATGSAAGCCIAWLVRQGLVASRETVEIEQGIEIQRPSRILVSAVGEFDRVHSVAVSGRTIPVAEGRLFLP